MALGEIWFCRVPESSSPRWKEISCAWLGEGGGRLLSHLVGRAVRRNVGLPSVELTLDEVPQPWGLAAPSQACSQ